MWENLSQATAYLKHQNFPREITTVVTFCLGPPLVSDRDYALNFGMSGVRIFHCFYPPISDHLSCMYYTNRRMRCSLSDNMKLNISLFRNCIKWVFLQNLDSLGPLAHCGSSLVSNHASVSWPLTLRILGGYLRKVWLDTFSRFWNVATSSILAFVRTGKLP